MPLTIAQRSIIEKARALGAGGQGIALDDRACKYLIAVIAKDLRRTDQFPEYGDLGSLPTFFQMGSLDELSLPSDSFDVLIERLLSLDPNTDMYFACLAKLYKSRLKYELILRSQPLPTIDQVGPRGLLQFGKMSPSALVGFMFWRKWMFDIDNRAGQETGYVFEPIIANSIGGTPASARRSPVRRRLNTDQGRQIDCLRGDKAYELKLRVTIAASGQGRWSEELEFPSDCRGSGYTPVLVVLDPTRNPKLDELERAFLEHGGEVYIGDDAWSHLESVSGTTMALFLERYVHSPINEMLIAAPEQLPTIKMTMNSAQLIVDVAGEAFEVVRVSRMSALSPTEAETVEIDLDDETVGP